MEAHYKIFQATIGKGGINTIIQFILSVVHIPLTKLIQIILHSLIFDFLIHDSFSV